MLKRASDRLLSKAPERYRPALKWLLIVLGGGFVLFEFSRFAIVAAGLVPVVEALGPQISAVAAKPPLIAIVSLGVGAGFFLAAMGLFAFALLRLRSLVKRHFG